MTDPMPDRELEEARRVAQDTLRGNYGPDWTLLARAFLALDRAGGRSEREARLRTALEGADERFEAILYAKGTLEEKVERMAQEAYFGQREVVKALTAQGPPRERQGE